MKNKLRLVYITLNVLMLWFALILQFCISTKEFMTKGRSMAGALLHIASYFTIETNILIAVALTVLLVKPASAWGRFFSRASTLTAIAVYIVIVGLIYALVLKGIVELNGLFQLTDFLLHTLSPITFVIFWMMFTPHEKIKWRNIIPWSAFPLLYLVYSLIRGSISGDYPYPFLDAAQFGYGQVAINSIYVLIVFLALSAIFIGGSRLILKHKPTTVRNT